ncbi:ABC transporter permease [Nakamurella deserti]|uniref:ABC transporter permease n=1 Tax=Nakamurella deserti TaxID=2164074 RepID=UPI000DBE981E|nr:ABC transporter permease [Nakamurella deserti]
MTRYLLGRAGQALLVLWATFTAAFVLLQALPGDALLIKFQNPELGLSPEQIADIRVSYGADTSLVTQYLHALGNFVTLDWGYSIQADVPVSQQLATNIPPTLRLAVLGLALAVVLAVGIAVLANLSPFRWLRSLLESLPALFISVPVFWLGIMLIQLFSFRLKLIPVINPGFWEGLILPVLTLAVPISAPLAQVLLRSIDDVRTQPFVTVARARGAGDAWVLTRHIGRNAVLPTLTIAGILLGELIGGAAITEIVFGLNGIGQMTESAVRSQDAPVLQAVVMLSAVVFVLVNLVVDLLYPVLDPRLKSKVSV